MELKITAKLMMMDIVRMVRMEMTRNNKLTFEDDFLRMKQTHD